MSGSYAQDPLCSTGPSRSEAGILTVTGESTLCTLLSSTSISLEMEDQGHS